MSSKHSRRHDRARMIRAAMRCELFHAEASAVDWIQAAAEADANGADKPKRFTMTAYTGGDMRVNAYGDPVIVDLATLKAEAPLPILLTHNLDQIVGHAGEVTVSASAVKIAGVVSGAGPAAAEVLGSARNGFPWKASVGVMPTRDGLEYVGEGVSTKVNGRMFKGPLIVARGAILREVSFVAVGADGRTSVKVAASAAQQGECTMDEQLRAWILAMGLVPENLSDDQVVKIKAQWQAKIDAAAKTAPAGAPPTVDPPKFDLTGAIECCETHNAAIEAAAAGFAGKIDAPKLAEIVNKARSSALEIKAKALAERWPVPRVEVEMVKAKHAVDVALIRGERPTGPAIHSSSRDLTAPVLEAALARSAGLQNMERHYKPEVMEAAAKSFRGMGLQECLLMQAQANGYSGRGFRINDGNLRDVLEYAFRPIQAGFSTVSLPGIFSNVANKFLLAGFDTVEQVWREIAAVRPVNDFKTITSYRLTGDFKYLEVGPDGELKHDTVGEESYTNQAKTYGRMFTLSRVNIINDDLGAFDSIRTRLGRGGALKFNEVFWASFLDNAAFFTAGRGNYQSGAGSALSEAALGAAVQLFRDMKDADGNPMAVVPAMLLVPSALEATAKKLYVSTEMRDTTATTKYPTANIYQNAYRPAVSAYLSAAALGGSSAGWYLLANAADMPVMEACFLNGQQQPTVESAEADFSVLGIQFRGYHDFGVTKREYRGGVKSAGQ